MLGLEQLLPKVSPEPGTPVPSSMPICGRPLEIPALSLISLPKPQWWSAAYGAGILKSHYKLYTGCTQCILH